VTGPVVLLKGSEPSLIADALGTLVDDLLDGGSRAESVDELADDDYELGDAVIAANSVSMFGTRVVIARQAAKFAAHEVAAVINYLEDTNDQSTLVLAWEKPTKTGAKAHAVPKKLSDAIKKAGGEVRDCSPPRQAKARQGWLNERIAEAGIKLDAGATRLLGDTLGDDMDRVGGVLNLLASAYPSSSKLSSDDVAPYLGRQGGVPPWDLTDAIDKGDVKTAIANLQRMIGGGGRHPLQVMATLQGHFEKMLTLDGAGVTTEAEASDLLGVKGFPAKKALQASRTYGSAGIKRAIHLLAIADADLRGRTAVPEAAVMDVLVGRLARTAGG
jgi:DNA polymerase-3 subunit delta